MKTIKPFIDLGIHTVPLEGQLIREANGKKTIPIFEKNWRVKYQEEFNEEAAALGGAITGSISGIVAIDCDNASTYSLFKSLDPDNKFHFISRGKPQGGGTIIYTYPEHEALPSFSLHDDNIQLDYYSDNGFVYLPTTKNKTKENWEAETFEDLPKLMGMPQTVFTLLQTLYQQYKLQQVRADAPQDKIHSIQIANFLAPSLELLLDKQEFMPTLFRIITPKDFRELPQYVKHGYLHPKNIPEGRGSEYLSKVSAILGADSSVDKTLYERAIKFINEMWDEPMPSNRLMSTVIKPMKEGKATANGEPIWSYDPNWKDRGFSFINKLGEAVEVFFDDVRSQFYLVNFTRETITSYYRDTDIFGYIQTVGLGLPPTKQFKNMMPLVRTINDPSKPFGFFAIDEYTRSFNTFNQSPELAILSNPGSYQDFYQEPTTILKYLESFVPHKASRIYLLKFLRKKFTTFDYSPVILYFLGAHGSGKDTFVNLIGSIIGSSYIARPTTKEFLEQFNGWLIDKYFIQLDEYGNQLTRYNEKQEALGKIKAYTGKQEVQIRQMRTDGFNYKHTATFILTANTNPLLLEEGDRRAHIMETPTPMNQLEWIEEAGGLKAVQEKLLRETKDFCYYLATEIEDMTYDEYVSPPLSKAKQLIIAKSLPAGARIAYLLKHNMFDEIEKFAEEFELPQLLHYAGEQRIYEDDLFELYLGLTDQSGTKRGLSVAMQDADIKKIPTTRNGHKAYYYRIPSLKYYESYSGGFDEVTIELEE